MNLKQKLQREKDRKNEEMKSICPEKIYKVN